MRVSLRTLFMGITVLAVAVSLSANKYRNRRAAIAAIEERLGTVYFEDQDAWVLLPQELSGTVSRIEFRSTPLGEDVIRACEQLHETTEVRIFRSRVETSDCEVVARLPLLAELVLFECQIEEGALAGLKGCRNLQEVCLSWSDAGDDDCEQLTKCQSIRAVHLMGTKISDRGLLSLSELPSFSVLTTSEEHVTEAGLEQLLSRKELTYLCSYGSGYSDEWWTRMKARYPDCRIQR